MAVSAMIVAKWNRNLSLFLCFGALRCVSAKRKIFGISFSETECAHCCVSQNKLTTYTSNKRFGAKLKSQFFMVALG